MKTLHICSHCNSNAVKVKAWVNPNNNNEFVDKVEGNELGWCKDCNQYAAITTAEFKDDAKVVGFQVVSDDGKNCNHPHMDASFCIYNLNQAKSMMDDDNLGTEQWVLVTIWSEDIEDPTFMFEGDPRN